MVQRPLTNAIGIYHIYKNSMCVGSLNIDVWWVWFYLWVNELDEFVSVECWMWFHFYTYQGLVRGLRFIQQYFRLKSSSMQPFWNPKPLIETNTGVDSVLREKGNFRATGWENRIHAVYIVWRSREFWIQSVIWEESFQYSCYRDKKAIADISYTLYGNFAKLSCLGDLENPDQLPVQR